MIRASKHSTGMGVDVRNDGHDHVRGVVQLVERARWHLRSYAAARPLREFVVFAEPRSSSEIAGMAEYAKLYELSRAMVRYLDGKSAPYEAFAEAVSETLLATPLPTVQYSRQAVGACEQRQWADARRFYDAAACA